MAWVPIQESGIEFTFVPDTAFGGVATLTDSIATSDTGTPPSGSLIANWSLQFSNSSGRDPVMLRLSAQSFAASGSNTGFAWDGDTPGSQANTSLTPTTAWEPSPFEATITFDGSGGVNTFSNEITPEDSSQTSQFLIEVNVEGPGPPVPPLDGDPYVIRGSHRIFQCADTPVTAWVRTETGKLDLTGQELSVVIESGNRELVTLPATSSEIGKLEFTVPAETIKHSFPRLGPYVIKAFAGSRVIYTALLEVV